MYLKTPVIVQRKISHKRNSMYDWTDMASEIILKYLSIYLSIYCCISLPEYINSYPVRSTVSTAMHQDSYSKKIRLNSCSIWVANAQSLHNNRNRGRPKWEGISSCWLMLIQILSIFSIKTFKCFVAGLF